MLRTPPNSPSWYAPAAPYAAAHASSATSTAAASEAASRRTAGESTRGDVPVRRLQRAWVPPLLRGRYVDRLGPGRRVELPVVHHELDRLRSGRRGAGVAELDRAQGRLVVGYRRRARQRQHARVRVVRAADAELVGERK